MNLCCLILRVSAASGRNSPLEKVALWGKVAGGNRQGGAMFLFGVTGGTWLPESTGAPGRPLKHCETRKSTRGACSRTSGAAAGRQPPAGSLRHSLLPRAPAAPAPAPAGPPPAAGRRPPAAGLRPGACGIPWCPEHPQHLLPHQRAPPPVAAGPRYRRPPAPSTGVDLQRERIVAREKSRVL